MNKNIPLSGGFGNKKPFSRSRFDQLNDTFKYPGKAGKFVVVNSEESGLDVTSGGGVTAHEIGGGDHLSDTIAHLQTKVSDGSLITSAASEISALTAKGTPTTSDLLVIEDAADSNNKKKITIGNLPAATPAAHNFAGSQHSADTLANLNGKISDADVLSTAAAEISALTAKGTPTTSDLLVIEDVADSNNKKKITIGNLPAATPAAHDLAGSQHNADTIINLNLKLSDGDLISTRQAEISGIPSKITPVGADLLLIEDSADSYKKKQINIAYLPPATPAAHNIGGSCHNADTITNLNLKLSDGDVLSTKAAEISALTAKGTPTTSDLLVIEDVADSNNKKKITIGDLPAPAPSAHDFGGSQHNADTLAHVNDKISDADLISTKAGEIYALTAKSIPVNADMILIEDSENSNAKKKATLDTIRNKYWLPPVKSVYDNTAGLPGTPTTGDRYIAKVTANGWVANHIYEWSGSAWVDTPNIAGMAVYNNDPDEIYSCDGPNWFASPILTDETARNLYLPVFSGNTGLMKKSHVIQTAAGAQIAQDGAYDTTIALLNELGVEKWYLLNENTLNNFHIYKVGVGAIFSIDFTAEKVKLPLITTNGLLRTSSANGTVIVLTTITDLNTLLTDGDLLTTKSAEISALTAKGTPTTSDLLVIEDVADSNNKKKITIGNLPAATPAAHNFAGSQHSADTLANLNGKISDADVLSTAAAEISNLTQKTTPTTSDLLLIEDVAASNAKKRITIASLPAATPAAHNFAGSQHSADTLANLNGKISDADVLSTAAAEISALTEKTAPVSADLLLIEDSAASNAKKKVSVSNISKAITPFPEFQFFADQLKTPVSSEWPRYGSAAATLAQDSANNALLNRQFDDTADEGVGLDIFIPSGATNIIFDFYSRAQTAPGTAKQVLPGIYLRQISDNAAIGSFSSLTALTAIDIPITNAYYQYDTQTISLATLSLTAGRLTQILLERTATSGTDTLVGDWNLNLLRIRFS